MARHLWLTTFLACWLLLALGCKSGGSSTTLDASDVTNGDTLAADSDLQNPPSFAEIETTRTSDGGRVLLTPTNSCHRLEATPIQVPGWLIIAATPNGSCLSAGGEIWGLRLATLTLHRIAALPAVGSALVWPADGTVFGSLANGGVFQLASGTLAPTTTPNSVSALVTTSPLRLDQRLYLGTGPRVTSPCSEASPDCGAVLALSLDGSLLAQLSVDRGFEATVTASPTSDGERIFVGTGIGIAGTTSYRHACSVVRLDRTLAVTARFDPGASGCRQNGARHDRVSGEPVIGRSALWAIFADAVDDSGNGALVQLDFDLVERCRVPLPAPSDRPIVDGMQALVLDQDGRAYLAVNRPGSNGTVGALLQVDSDCQSVTLAALDSPVSSTPILVDDRFVLLAVAGTLRVYDLQGGDPQTSPLASSAQTLASPVLVDGLLVVAQLDGALTIWPSSGFSGYGKALWPRPRRDNTGLATAPAVGP